MTVRFVSAVDGNNANGGTSWADAKQTVAGALAISAAGDFIKVDSAGTFTANLAITWTPPAGQISIVSVNRAGSDAWLAGATEAVGAASAAFTIANVDGASVFVYGMTIKAGTNNNAACDLAIYNASGATSLITMWSCVLELTSASTGTQLILGPSTTATARALYGSFQNCTLKCSGSRAGTYCFIQHGIWEFIGATVSMTGGTKPAVFFAANVVSDVCTAIFRDADMSGYSVSGGAWFGVATMSRTTVLMKNLKISATPTLTTGTWVTGETGSITQRNVDSGNTLYVFQYNNYAGTLTESTTVYAANGALFNGSGISWQIVTTSACAEGYPFVTPPLREWMPTTASQTITVEFIRDSATLLTDRDAWLTYEYATSSSFPNYAYTSTQNANPFIGTAVTYSTSSTTWTGTGGFATASAQKFTIGFTASAVGVVAGNIVVGKASETIYFDPKLKWQNDTSATRWLDGGSFQEQAPPAVTIASRIVGGTLAA